MLNQGKRFVAVMALDSGEKYKFVDVLYDVSSSREAALRRHGDLEC